MVIEAIADLHLVRGYTLAVWFKVVFIVNPTFLPVQSKWKDRVKGRSFMNCYVSIYGTDFRISEPLPFNKKWFSHKFRGAGLRYEVGLCIESGLRAWCYGTFPVGSWPDLKIFEHGLLHIMEEGEKVITDKGYRHELCLTSADDAQLFISIRAHHETVTERIKQFNVLLHRFRHGLSQHADCFFAVANVVQLTWK